jgi:hypothetical protein
MSGQAMMIYKLLSNSYKYLSDGSTKQPFNMYKI